MQFKDYVVKVDYDDDTDIFHGEVTNIRDVVTFQGRSVTELKKAFRASIEDYISFCKSRKEDPDQPTGRGELRHSPR